LDRTTLDAAYARYSQEKQAAYLRDKELERQELLQQQQQQQLPSQMYNAQEWKRDMTQEPIPGLDMGGDSTGLFASLNSAAVPSN